MTAPAHAAARRWYAELLDWLLDVAATIAGRACRRRRARRITPQAPAAVPPGVPDAPAAPTAGAQSPVPPFPPGPGTSTDHLWPGGPATAPAGSRRSDEQQFARAYLDTWVVTPPSGRHVTAAPRTVPAQRTPTRPNPVYRPLPLVRVPPWLAILRDDHGVERYRMADAGRWLDARDAARTVAG